MDFIVLSSSRGTTFQAVIDAITDGSLTARCLGLVTDREDRGCVTKARTAGIPVVIVERPAFTKARAGRQKGKEREEYDRELHTAIEELANIANCKLQDVIIACMGWMFILSTWFVKRWHKRILNVHPSLLPKYPGGHAEDDALNAGDSETGMSIHWIDEGLDTGKIIVQKKCSINPNDTIDTLKERIQELEMEWYPKVLQDLETGKLKMEN